MLSKLKFVIVITTAMLYFVSCGLVDESDSSLSEVNSSNEVNSSKNKVELKSYSETRPIYIDRKEYKEEDIIHADVGDIVIFGDRDTSSTYIPMKWHVIKKSENIYTLFCTDEFYCERFSWYAEDSDWESCELRSYLNTTFYNNYFTDEERKIIIETKVKNDIGNDTLDYVYIPSVEETLELEEDIRYVMPERGGNKPSGWTSGYWTRTHNLSEPTKLFTVGYDEIFYGGYGERQYDRTECFRPIINIKVQ